MPKKFFKPVATALLLTLITSQNLYAFSPAFIPPSAPNLSVIVSQNQALTYTELGTKLGLDPRISTLIGTPIANGIGGFLTGAANAGQNLIRSVQEGLVNGAIGYGLHFATGTISDPLLGSLASRALAGALEGALMQGNIFQGVFDAAKESVLNLFGGNRQQLLGNLVDFNVLVSQKGSLSAALEAYATDIFDRGTVESVFRSGGFASALLQPKQDILLPTGAWAKESVLSNGTSVLFDTQGNFIGLKRDNIIQLGRFGITDVGIFGLKEGQIFSGSASNQYAGTVKDGQAITLTIDAGGNEIKIVGNDNPSNPAVPSDVVFDQTGQLIDGTIDFGIGAYKLVFKDGYLSNFFISNAEASMVIGGETITIPKLDIAPGALSGSTTQTGERANPKFLTRFMGNFDPEFREYETVNRERKLFTNTIGELYTTNSFSVFDTPKQAADSLQLGYGIPYTMDSGLDTRRAGYFVVFDTENLTPAPPDATGIDRKYMDFQGRVPLPGEKTGREQVKFLGAARSAIINLAETIRDGVQRLVYIGRNNIFERLIAVFKMGVRQVFGV